MNEMRDICIQRRTAETDISLSFNAYGQGRAMVDSGCGFLDHMLTLLAHHGSFDLELRCLGDVEVDYHHSVEDIGICLGQAIAQTIGDSRGLTRYGSMILPMDEALILSAVDCSGRAWLSWQVELPSAQVGDFDTELAEEFFRALVREARITLHIQELAGSNTHHILEGVFKSFARSLRQALTRQGDAIPSSKGLI